MTNFLNGNYLKLLRNGSEYFPALEAAIDQAQQEIFLESYIYQNDAIGQRIANALTKAAKRGVNVYVLLDAFGSQAMHIDFRLSLQSAGIHLMFYRPQISPW